LDKLSYVKSWPHFIKGLKEKALGIEKIEAFTELKDLIEGAFELVKADFMSFTYSFPSENVFYWKTQQCFAHDGIKETGVIDQYKCAIFDRIEGWFDSLGIKYSVTPHVDGCMMSTNANCFRDFRLYF